MFSAFAFAAPVTLPYGACTLQVNPAVAIVEFVGVADPQGQAQFGLPLPNAYGLAGLRLTGQALMLANNGPLLGTAELSNGVELVLGF